MILCHSKKFIFIRNKKTGSSSCESIFGDLLTVGDQQNMSLLMPEFSEKKLKKLQKRVAKDQAFVSLIPVPYERQKIPNSRDRMYRIKSDPKAYREYFIKGTHAGATDVRSSLDGTSLWNDYFTFCFDRNPWDKALSWYFYRFRKKIQDDSSDRREHFNNAVREGVQTSPKSIRYDLDQIMDHKHYMPNGKLIVDHVARFEDFDREVLYLLDRINGSQIDEVPHLNEGVGADIRKNLEYRKWYDSDTRDLIQEKFADSIELLGYEF